MRKAAAAGWSQLPPLLQAATAGREGGAAAADRGCTPQAPGEQWQQFESDLKQASPGLRCHGYHAEEVGLVRAAAVIEGHPVRFPSIQRILPTLSCWLAVSCGSSD